MHLYFFFVFFPLQAVAVASSLFSLQPVRSPLQQYARPVVRRTTTPFLPPPQRDSFHVGPAGYEATRPGTILRSRPIPPISPAAQSYQLLFRSVDSIGAPSAVVTTVLVPANASTRTLLSVQEHYDSCNVSCSPSYTLPTAGQNATNPEGRMIEFALRNGWYVNLPDYEGFDAAFTNGVQAGHAVLDSLRAALHSRNVTGVDTDATTVIAGYSGGGQASAWAAELLSTYAPELRIAGALLGGLTPNITNVLLDVSGTAYAGLAPVGLRGLSAQLPDLRRYLEERLVPANASMFNGACAQCIDAELEQFEGRDILGYFEDGVETFAAPEVQGYVSEYANLGHVTPRVPLYVYKGVQDQVSPVGDTDGLVAAYCDDGADVQYVRNSTTDHFEEEITGEADALGWIRDRMKDVSVAKGCSVKTT